MPVFALSQLPELSACLGAGNTDPRVFKRHSVALYQVMRLSLKDVFDHLRDALLLLHGSSFPFPKGDDPEDADILHQKV